MSKVFFSYIGLSIIYIVIQLFLDIFINEDQGKLVTQVVVLIFIILLLEPYLKGFRDSSDNSEFKLVKEQNSKKRQLYIRLGDEFDTDLFIYEIVGNQKEGNNDLADLKMFKAKVIEKVGPNLHDYYIIRQAIEIKLKSGFLYFLSDISKKILISTITVIISGLFITSAINIINNNESKLGLLTLLIQFANSGLFTLIIIHMIFYSFKGMKNRALLLKSIIELIISEKEKENNKSYTIIV